MAHSTATIGTPKLRLRLASLITSQQQPPPMNSIFSSIHNSIFSSSDVSPFSIHALNRLPQPGHQASIPPLPSHLPHSTRTSRIKSSLHDVSTKRNAATANLSCWDLSLLQEKNPQQIVTLDICNDSSCSETGDCSSGSYRNLKRPIPSEQKDFKYFERRRRNNMAAKKSRDARKNREDQLAMSVAELEKENAILRAHVAFFQEEMNMLQLCLLQKSNTGFTPSGKHDLNGPPRSIPNS